jgi:ERF superfamily protein
MMESLPVPQDQPIEKLLTLAIEKKVDVAILERLLSMQERVLATQAKIAFEEALSSFQAKCPVIPRTKKGAKAKYAPYEDIVKRISPLLEECGLSVNTKTKTSETTVRAFTIIRHKLGYSEELGDAELPLLRPVVSNTGNVAMNETQAVAGTISMCKRYSLCNALNIVTENEDLDGNGGEEEAISEENLKELYRLQSILNFNMGAILTKYKIKKIYQLDNEIAENLIKNLQELQGKEKKNGN